MKNVEATKKKSLANTAEKTETKREIMTLSIEDLSEVNGGRRVYEMRQQGLITTT